MKRVALVLIAACAIPAGATGLKDLENFVRTVKTGRADFTQTVTAPAKEGQAPRTKVTSGTFEFARPGRFKFVYTKPFAQTLVADGQTLWLYDVDLNQVTARKQAAVLGSTPAALVASAPDLKALQRDFELSDQPTQDGLEWVLASPKAKDSSLQSVRIGFKGAELAALEILDSFGQKSLMRFGAVQANVPMDAAHFAFKPPAGVDVVRQ